MSELQEILKMIEELRAKLNAMTVGKRITDPGVISTSHMLDTVLNEYQRFMIDKRNRS